jgi:hypothetical protein
LHDIAKQQSVKLLLLQIPREVMEQQAVDKGDIQFYELAYLDVEIKKPKKLTVSVTLKDFVIPNTELIPEEVRSKVKKWSDYIDYWALEFPERYVHAGVGHVPDAQGSRVSPHLRLAQL